MDEFKSESNGWFSPRFFGRVMRAIFHRIQDQPTAWSKQSHDLKADVKYIDIRIDQRTGHFVVKGRVDGFIDRALTTEELIKHYPRISMYADVEIEKMVHHLVMGWLINHYTERGMDFLERDPATGKITGPFSVSFLLLIAETTGLIMLYKQQPSATLPKHTKLQAQILDEVVRFI